jgi:endonuclease III related protein
LDENRQIRSYFETLRSAWGAQHWWPAESPFEVIVGAILTQNTAWTNVERALANLRTAQVLSVDAIRRIPLTDLEKMVQPSGFFLQKAARLKRFVEWLDERYEGSLEKMFAQPTPKLRSELLALNGVGPETADSILLYAAQHEVFVVDAYARRIFERHGIATPESKYDKIRTMVESELRGRNGRQVSSARPLLSPTVEPGPGPAEETLRPKVHAPTTMSQGPRSQLAQDYNEFHALIVQVGKHYCLSRVARCEECPLRVYLKRKPVLANGTTVKRKPAKRKNVNRGS